jgi:hypothetical protein
VLLGDSLALAYELDQFHLTGGLGRENRRGDAADAQALVLEPGYEP